MVYIYIYITYYIYNIYRTLGLIKRPILTNSWWQALWRGSKLQDPGLWRGSETIRSVTPTDFRCAEWIDRRCYRSAAGHRVRALVVVLVKYISVCDISSWSEHFDMLYVVLDRHRLMVWRPTPGGLPAPGPAPAGGVRPQPSAGGFRSTDISRDWNCVTSVQLLGLASLTGTPN